jgi:hypothetical protein
VGVKCKWQASFENLLLIYLRNNRSEGMSCHTTDKKCITDITTSLQIAKQL